MIEPNAVTSVQIIDSSVTEAKIAHHAIDSIKLKSLSTLLIKDSAGSTLKTIHGAGV